MPGSRSTAAEQELLGIKTKQPQPGIRTRFEFYRVQKVEDQFHRDFDGLDST